MTALETADRPSAAPTLADVEAAAAASADDVDRCARFPKESLDAARAAGLLGALVPAELGGGGATFSEVGQTVYAIGRHCASSAMVLAMHHLQVACLARHGATAELRRYLAEVAAAPYLLASATTEAGVGGNLRTSICALERADGRFTLDKQAAVISYGAHADAILATCRRGPDAPPSDQVLVVCRRPGLVLEQVSEWDTLGFRGTDSPGFVLRAEGGEDQVLPDAFGDVAAQTMMPVSHVLWGFVWLGLASGAMAKARRYVQAEARKAPGTTPAGATRLAELVVAYQQMDGLVRGAARRLDETPPGREPGLGEAISFNALKVSASTLVVDIVERALRICGMAGYSQRSPFSLGRHLRDALGAALMVNNDRILADNAQMLLISRDDG
jgi:acyl-CoA dehydrogenase